MSSAARAWLVLLPACALLVACARPAPRTALVVRDLESKCAWIAFSGCPPRTDSSRTQASSPGDSLSR